MVMQHEGQPNSYAVLIVEDNLLMRKILEDHLIDLGHTVVAVENGRQALEMLERSHFQIVITDLVMPQMGGLELCRAIRGCCFDGYIYIVMLTSLDSKDEMVRGLEAGADEYLIKPVNRAELTVRLKTADRILSLESSLKNSYEEIKALSVKDPLTKVYNRGYMDEKLVHEVKRSFRFERPISLIMLDIDHFKIINDTFGHLIGDRVLEECAKLMNTSVRKEIDWVARYGGEEFVIVLPETPLPGALVAAERFRSNLASYVVDASGAELSVTASFGVSSFTPPSQKEDLGMASVLLAQADLCLYQAKKKGRTCVVSTLL
jgi:diguanylate cyclase (GGDEF)-like protein